MRKQLHKARASANAEKRNRYLELLKSGVSPKEIMEKEGIEKLTLQISLKHTKAWLKFKQNQRAENEKNNFEKMLLFAQQQKRVPPLIDMYEAGIPQKSAFRIQKLLIKKGFKRKRQETVSKEMVLADLRRINKLINKTPSVRDVEKYSQYSMISVYKYFSSISDARVMAGLKSKVEWRLKASFDNPNAQGFKKLRGSSVVRKTN